MDTIHCKTACTVTLIYCIVPCYLNIEIIYLSFKSKRRSCIWGMRYLTLSVLRLLSSRAQGHVHFCEPSKPCHVGICWIALAEHSQMNARISAVFQFFLHPFVLAKLATGSMRVKQVDG